MASGHAVPHLGHSLCTFEPQLEHYFLGKAVPRPAPLQLVRGPYTDPHNTPHCQDCPFFAFCARSYA